MRTALIIPLAIIAITAVMLFVTGAIIAVFNDSKGRGAKNSGLWTILTLCSPFIVGIIYYFKKDSLASGMPKICNNCGTSFDNDKFICPNCSVTEYTFSEVPNKEEYLAKAKKWAKISIISLVIYFVMMISVFAVSACLPGEYDTANSETEPSDAIHYAYDVDGVQTYYDMKGNAYTDPNDVLFYDESGNIYKYYKQTGGYICNGNEYFSFNSFVDKNGYFVYNEPQKITYDSDIDTEKWIDEDNNKYAHSFEASWDADGNLVDSFTGEPLF